MHKLWSSQRLLWGLTCLAPLRGTVKVYTFRFVFTRWVFTFRSVDSWKKNKLFIHVYDVFAVFHFPRPFSPVSNICYRLKSPIEIFPINLIMHFRFRRDTPFKYHVWIKLRGNKKKNSRLISYNLSHSTLSM